MNQRIKKIFLLTGDIIVLYCTLYFSVYIRSIAGSNASITTPLLWHFSTIFIAWIVIFYISDLYNLHIANNNFKFFNSTFKAVLFSSFISIVYFYLNSNVGVSPKTILFIFVLVFFVLFLIWRNIFNSLLTSYLPKNNIGIIGYNQDVTELIKTIQKKPHLGYNTSFVINNDEINKISNIKNLIIKNHVSTILMASDINSSPGLRHELLASLTLKINILNLPKFYESITGKVPIDSINQMWFLENLSEGSKKWFNIIKRTYDITFSVVIIILTFIFWPIIGLIIKHESTGPIFFHQTRSGKNNKKFTIIKFRTMSVSGNNHTPTTSNDARVTKFGNFLRKTRIDEIPQVLNILKGEMSFVGPRPERPEFVEILSKEIPFYNERILVKPGLTGWDQVSGEYHSPSKEDSIKKIQYDLFYIKNRSIYLDLSIILKTIATVLSKAGV